VAVEEAALGFGWSRRPVGQGRWRGQEISSGEIVVDGSDGGEPMGGGSGGEGKRYEWLGRAELGRGGWWAEARVVGRRGHEEKDEQTTRARKTNPNNKVAECFWSRGDS
jgi:hypothetical protein